MHYINFVIITWKIHSYSIQTNQALKYIVNKPLHHNSMCHWLLLFQEFEFKVVFKPIHTNVGLDHLLRIQIGTELSSIDNDFPDAHLFRVEGVIEELANIFQFLQEGKALEGLTKIKKKILSIREDPYTLINGSLYKLGQDDILL